MSDFNNSGHYDHNVILQGNAGPIHIGGAPPPDPEAATRLLADLPLDRVPDPHPLSVPHRLVFNTNPLFVGRDADLMALAQRLKQGGTTAIAPAAVATGMGGLGKTQLATEFAHRYGRYFAGGVFWVTLADANMAEAEVAACAAALGMAEGTIGDKAAFVLSAWAHGLPSLLIFDNCEDEALLRRWRPKGGAARLLVTSRRQEWSATLGVTIHALAVLARPHAVAMLCRYRPDLSPEDADLNAIAASLGDLPLALHMAGSFLRSYRHNSNLGSPSAYRAALRAGSPLAHASLTGCRDTSPTGYDRHVAAAFALSYERLHPTNDALARTLLFAAAACAPGEPIPRWLLTDTATRLDPAPDAMAVEDALDRLVELGLIKPDEHGALTLHRLLAAFVGALGDVASAQAHLWETALARANAQIDAGYPAPLIAWEVHFEWLTQAADAAQAGIRLYLLAWLGTFYMLTGRYTRARQILESALQICEAAHGPGHPLVAKSLNNLAMALTDQGKALEALPLMERALKIGDASQRPDHPDVAIRLINLARVLRDLGRASDALPLLIRALQIYKDVDRLNHPNVAQALDNLAMALKDLELASDARPLLERALRIGEEAQGPDHPHVANHLSNLATVLQNLGKASDARPLLERALRIDEAAHGPVHPNVAIRLSNLALVLNDMGRPSEARPLLDRAVSIATATLGPDDPRTALYRNNLRNLPPS